MSKKKKRAKEDGPVRQLELPTGVVSRFVKGAKEGVPEREALAKVRFAGAEAAGHGNERNAAPAAERKARVLMEGVSRG